MRRVVLLALLAAPIAHACQDAREESMGTDTAGETGLPPLSQAFETSLVRHGGCGDTVLYAANDRDTVALTFHAPDLVATVDDEARTHAWRLPADDVELEVQTGVNLTDGTCDDVLEGNVIVDKVYRPVSGTAMLTLHPGEDDTRYADLTLQDVVFVPVDGGVPVQVERLRWAHIEVGRSAG